MIRLRLSQRVHLFHVVAFVLAAAVLTAVGPRRGAPPPPVSLSDVAALVGERLHAHHGDWRAAEAEARAWQVHLGLAVTAFDDAGAVLLDTGAQSALPTAQRLQLTATPTQLERPGAVALRLPDGRTTAAIEVAWTPPRPPGGTALFGGLALLSAVILASVAFSRTLVGPIEQLARAIEAFGAGDLAARASLARGDELSGARRSCSPTSPTSCAPRSPGSRWRWSSPGRARPSRRTR